MPDTYFGQDESPTTADEAITQPAEQRSSRFKPSKKVIFGGLLLIVLLGGGITAVVQWMGDKKSNENRALNIEVVSVYITPEGFVPANLSIEPHTQVMWTNKDSVSHELSVRDKDARQLDIFERLAPQESFSVLLDEERDYHFHSPASGEKFQGVITVKSKAARNE